MTADYRFHHTQMLRSVLATLVLPLQLALDAPARLIAAAGEQFSFRQTLIERNAALEEANLKLRAILQKQAALEQENDRLRALLGSSKQLRETTFVAELLSIDLDPFRQQIVINRGTREGVYRGQPVIDAAGVVGQIVEVFPFHSVALLITDPSHALPVQVRRTGLRSIAVGTGRSNELQLRFVPPSEDINVGDILTTSGLGGRFPPDYPVAEVTALDRPPGEPFARVTARPLARLDRGREVLLVRPPQEPTVPAPHEAEPANG